MQDSWPQITSTIPFQTRVKDARILVVGSGGIGCELLKTLAVTGFRKLDLIDMDTIETSNLNRQFLFRRHHVGQSKSKIAAESVKKFCPGADIRAHCANIKDPQYGVDFFKQFVIVMNGLDNLDARRHVNRLCLAAAVPLIESGTAGYKGQVTVHVKGVTRCYECVDKPSQKSYPICTIRNTPDKPIHCIVWAKDLLFLRLFGRKDLVTDLDETSGNNENETGEADPSFFAAKDGESAVDYSHRIFERIFNTDIYNVRKIANLWSSRTPPDPLVLSSILGNPIAKSHPAPNGQYPSNGHKSPEEGTCGGPPSLSNYHKVWTLEENTRVFLSSIQEFICDRSSDIGNIVFDKDDDLAVNFVTSAANLRCLCYGIDPQTRFDAKGMAGNIIHAIATTNAMVSGIMVIEALKVLSGNVDELRETYIGESVGTKHSRSQAMQRREMILKSGLADKPKKQCAVCGTSRLSLLIDTKKTTLSELIMKVLKGCLSINAPTIMCDGFFYEEGEGLEEDCLEEYAAMMPSSLEALPGGGLHNGSIMEVEDQMQNFKVGIIVNHKDDFDEDDPVKFKLEGEMPSAQPAEPVPSHKDEELLPDLMSSDDDILYMSDDEKEGPPKGVKRARDSGDDEDELEFVQTGVEDATLTNSGQKKRKLNS